MHTYEKSICYDPETRDFAMYLDGELVGFARTYLEAEITLDELIGELRRQRDHIADVTETAEQRGAA